MTILVQIVTTLVMSVLDQLTTVPYVMESENSLPMLMVLQMNVSVHPTIMNQKMTELAMNVVLLVLNVQFQLLTVTHAQLIEFKDLNQTAHAQMDNTKTDQDIVKIVHTDVKHVMEVPTIVMEKNVLTKPELWMNVSVYLDTMKLKAKPNVLYAKTSVKLALSLLINVILVLKEELMKSQNVHAQLEHMKMEKKFVKIVVMLVKLVKDLPMIVPNVPMITDP